MSLRNEQFLFLQDVMKLCAFAVAEGFELTFGEVARTVEQQKIYVQTGRSKTMKSSHLDRLAVDFNIFKGGKLCGRDEIKPLGNYWESLAPQNRWGGNWRGLVDAKKSTFVDAPHFERKV